MPGSFRLSLAAALIALMLLVAGCGGGDGDTSAAGTDPTSSADSDSGGSGEMTEVTTDYLPGTSLVALKLGESQGFFEKHGIKLKYVPPAANGAARIAQLLSGQLTVAGGAVTAVQTAAAEDFGVSLISAFEKDHTEDGIPSYATVASADSGVTSFKDLEGKTVAVNSLAGTWEVTLKAAVAAEGGDPNSLELVAIPFPEQGAALEQGRVDAAATLQPFGEVMVKAGGKLLGDQQAIALDDPEGVSYVMFASNEFLAESPEVAEGFVEALAESGEYANEHPEEVQDLVIEETGAPPEVIRAAPAPKYTTVMTPQMLERWGELLVEYGILDSAPPADEILWEKAPTE